MSLASERFKVDEDDENAFGFPADQILLASGGLLDGEVRQYTGCLLTTTIGEISAPDVHRAEGTASFEWISDRD